MVYAQASDITDRYGEDFLFTIADRDHDDILDTTAIDSALADASGLMDSYLSTRYPLPRESIPDLLKRHCIDIAVYWLSEDGGGATEEKRQRYEDAIAWLDRIAKGKTDLPGYESTDGSSEGVTGSGAFFQSQERQFSREKLGGF